MLGLITFHWADDNGAMLQAYALKTYCSKHEKTEIIPYVPNGLERRYTLFKTDSLRSFVGSVKSMAHVITFLKRVRRRVHMHLFRRKYLTKKKGFADSELIPEFNSEISEYIVGSDQIWNPEITNGIADGYFCAFKSNAKKPCRCISYAASIGVERLDEKFDKRLSELLPNLDTITVREAASAPYIASLCDKQVGTVLDPVFLLDKAEWETVLPKIRARKPYIFYYSTEQNPEMAAYAERLSEENGLDILVFKQEYRAKWNKPVKRMFHIDPLEFAAYLKNADYVVTNSFHGTAFSIIFEKQFTVFAHSNKNSRLTALLDAAELRDRITSADRPVDITKTIDWQKKNEKLSECIAASKAYLDEAIDNSEL